jgi:hypothetical protein
MAKQTQLVLGRISFFQLVLFAVWRPERKVLVPPAQAKRQVESPILQIRGDRRLERTRALKPEELKAEGRDPVMSSKLDLAPHYIGYAEIVVAEIAWLPRLEVTGE